MAERIKERATKLDVIFQKLLQEAIRDGRLSEDEDRILSSAKKAMVNYKSFVDEALKDGVVTIKEHSRLLELQNELLRTVENEAALDNVISEDEKLLIETLKKMLKDF